MLYEYVCDECNVDVLREMSMKDKIPASVVCPRCGKMASRVWGNTTVKIPETFKATSESNEDNGANFDYIRNRMKHGTRPSGRSKIYY
jgi:putative FmdB family regulatory protein